MRRFDAVPFTAEIVAIQRHLHYRMFCKSLIRYFNFVFDTILNILVQLSKVETHRRAIFSPSADSSTKVLLLECNFILCCARAIMLGVILRLPPV